MQRRRRRRSKFDCGEKARVTRIWRKFLTAVDRDREGLVTMWVIECMRREAMRP